MIPFDLEIEMCSGSALANCVRFSSAMVMDPESIQQPFDIAYAGDAAHSYHQFFELLLIAHIDRHLDDSAIALLGVGPGLEAADVGVLGGEDGGELIEEAGAVVGADYQLDGELIRCAAGPLHLDLPLHLIHQVLHVGAGDRVYRDTLASRDV